MADLKALRQTGSVQEYHEAFDALTSRLNLSEEYLLSCYLGGLEDDIQLSVRIFSPKSIQQALFLAKLQEAASKAKKLIHSPKPPLLPTPSHVKPYSGASNALSKPFTPNADKFTTTKTITKPPLPTNRRTLTPAELSEKRAKNLCFWCDEQYIPGHKCKGKRPQFFHIEVADEDEEEVEELVQQEEQLEGENQCAQISLEAIEGITNFQTMRVTGHHGKKALQVLLDTGSTHNFIDMNSALKLDCRVEIITLMGVKVADGGQLVCDKIIKDFIWKMQGVEFQADVLLLPLSGSDMVLGIHWLSQLGPVVWDFAKLSMQSTYKGDKVKLRGSSQKKLKYTHS